MDFPGSCPIVVDLDHTLSEKNLMHYLFHQSSIGTKIKWFCNFLFHGRASANYQMAEQCDFSDTNLYLRNNLIKSLDRAAKTRQIIMATGSPQRLANYVASNVNFIHEIIASDNSTLKVGDVKAQILKERFPDGNFIYIGDSMQDLPVWDVAKFQIVVRQENNMHYIEEWKKKFPDMMIID